MVRKGHYPLARSVVEDDWESEIPPLPSRGARNEALLAWLSEQQAEVAALEKELSADRADLDRAAAVVATPASAFTVDVRDAPVLQSAHMESIRRQNTSPPRR